MDQDALDAPPALPVPVVTAAACPLRTWTWLLLLVGEREGFSLSMDMNTPRYVTYCQPWPAEKMHDALVSDAKEWCSSHQSTSSDLGKGHVLIRCTVTNPAF